MCVLGEKQSLHMHVWRIKVTGAQGVCAHSKNQSAYAHADNQSPWPARGAGLHSCPVSGGGPLERHGLSRLNTVAVCNEKKSPRVHEPRVKFIGTQFGLERLPRIRVPDLQEGLGYTTILCWWEACFHRGLRRPYATAAGCLGGGCAL